MTTAFSWWLFALYLAKGGDFVSTELVLRQPDFRESNPLMQDFRLRAAGTVLGPLAIEYMARYVDKRGNKKAAFVIRITAIVAWGYFTMHNLRNLE